MGCVCLDLARLAELFKLQPRVRLRRRKSVRRIHAPRTCHNSPPKLKVSTNDDTDYS